MARRRERLEDQRNAGALRELLGILSGEAVTSSDICRVMRCSDMVARSRLRQLARCGFKMVCGRSRIGERGPMARTYFLRQ